MFAFPWRNVLVTLSARHASSRSLFIARTSGTSGLLPRRFPDILDLVRPVYDPREDPGKTSDDSRGGRVLRYQNPGTPGLGLAYFPITCSTLYAHPSCEITRIDRHPRGRLEPLAIKRSVFPRRL